jgi:hypothetical protein
MPTPTPTPTPTPILQELILFMQARIVLILWVEMLTDFIHELIEVPTPVLY